MKTIQHFEGSGIYKAVAEHANEIVDVVNKQTELNPPWAESVGNFTAQGRPIECVVVSNGPTGESDYTDNRYWVQRVYPQQNSTADMTGLLTMTTSVADVEDQPITAHNLDEKKFGTHCLRPGSIVEVWLMDATKDSTDPEDYAQSIFMFNRRIGSVVVKIVSDGASGGRYSGKIMNGSAAPGSGDISMPMSMTVGVDCQILNMDENGLPTHVVMPLSFTIGTICGQDVSTPIVAVHSVLGKRDSPNTLGGINYTPDTHGWTRLANTTGDIYGSVPFSLDVVCRTVIKDNITTDKKFRNLHRIITVDAAGRFVTVSTEASTDVFDFIELECKKDVGGTVTSLTKPTRIITFTGLNVTSPATDELRVEGNLQSLNDVDVSTSVEFSADIVTVLGYSTSRDKWIRINVNELDVVIDVRWDSTTGTLQQRKETITGAFHTPGTGAYSDLGSYKDCPV